MDRPALFRNPWSHWAQPGQDTGPLHLWNGLPWKALSFKWETCLGEQTRDPPLVVFYQMAENHGKRPCQKQSTSPAWDPRPRAPNWALGLWLTGRESDARCGDWSTDILTIPLPTTDTALTRNQPGTPEL